MLKSFRVKKIRKFERNPRAADEVSHLFEVRRKTES